MKNMNFAFRGISALIVTGALASACTNDAKQVGRSSAQNPQTTTNNAGSNTAFQPTYPQNSNVIGSTTNGTAITQQGVSPSAVNAPGFIPPVEDVGPKTALLVPVTPIVNMENTYHVVSDGYAATLKDSSGRVIASGPMTMKAVTDGKNVESDDAYPKMILSIKLDYLAAEYQTGSRTGKSSGDGKLSLCFAQNLSKADDRGCKSLEGMMGSTSERASQLIEESVSYSIKSDGNIEITKFHNPKGDSWTSSKAGVSLLPPDRITITANRAVFADLQSPLVLNLTDSAKLDLIGPWDKRNHVHFDMTNSGQAEKMGWARKGAGILVLDANSNGSVDSGAELFGEYSQVIDSSKAPADKTAKTFSNGFLALEQYDDNHDRSIDRADKVFEKLAVWSDKNVNGKVDKGELKSMKKLGIKSLNLLYSSNSTNGVFPKIEGNELRLKSTFTTEDGKNHELFDVWFNVASKNTVAGTH